MSNEGHQSLLVHGVIFFRGVSVVATDSKENSKIIWSVIYTMTYIVYYACSFVHLKSLKYCRISMQKIYIMLFHVSEPHFKELEKQPYVFLVQTYL